jgi:SAM-dependent methyltransferase
MDELAQFNRERWNALVTAGVEYSQPFLDLTPESARERVDEDGWLGDVAGKHVLCLANGGGQQSACFALLGTQVTVLDLSDAQLEMDRKAAAHYGYSVEVAHGDMRDLSRFEAGAFDVVYHGYSINFVPDPRQVFAQVARVLREGGQYVVQCSNPHRYSIKEEVWTGTGYPLSETYRDGEVHSGDGHWDVSDAEGKAQRVLGPREFNHTWRTMINGLAEHGFVIGHFSEWMRQETNPEVGSWAHYTQVLPPYMTFWTTYRPDMLDTTKRM